MTNNSGKENGLSERKVEILKMVSQKWLFMIPVVRYPEYCLSEKVNSELEFFVNSIGCKLVECGSGTCCPQILIVAYTIKIEEENQKRVDELVQKINEYLTKQVVPII